MAQTPTKYELAINIKKELGLEDAGPGGSPAPTRISGLMSHIGRVSRVPSGYDGA